MIPEISLLSLSSLPSSHLDRGSQSQSHLPDWERREEVVRPAVMGRKGRKCPCFEGEGTEEREGGIASLLGGQSWDQGAPLPGTSSAKASSRVCAFTGVEMYTLHTELQTGWVCLDVGSCHIAAATIKSIPQKLLLKHHLINEFFPNKPP